MEAILHDLIAHNIQNRTVAVIENGSWAATSGNLIKEKFAKCKNINMLENTISIKSSLKIDQLTQLDEMVEAITKDFPKSAETLPFKAYNFNTTILVNENKESTTFVNAVPNGNINKNALCNISYGLFLLIAREDLKDNGCIINTVTQISENPMRISISVNKLNLTHDMIMKTGLFNISILTENTPYSFIEKFGFHSGRDVDKFKDITFRDVSANILKFLTKYSNSFISGKVIETYDFGSHTLFIADITEVEQLSYEPSMTYKYYFDHVKPKNVALPTDKKGHVCKVCAWFFEGDVLPDDIICPLCKHGKDDFEKV